MTILFFSAIVLSLLSCIFKFRKLHPLVTKYFVWFLLFYLFLECYGLYLSSHKIRNHWLYNIYIFIEFNFLNYIYFHAITTTRSRNIIKLFSLIYPLLFIINIAFIQGMHIFNTYSYVAGGVGVIVWTCMYFTELLSKPKYSSIIEQPLFWISTGLLFFYLGNIPFYGMINYLLKNYLGIVKNYFIIVLILNILKYSLYAVGFLCSKPK